METPTHSKDHEEVMLILVDLHLTGLCFLNCHLVFPFRLCCPQAPNQNKLRYHMN